VNYEQERREVVDAAHAMASSGLVVGSSGNVSRRLDGGLVAVTRHGVAKGNCTLEDVLIVDMEGNLAEEAGDYRPSVETGIHTQILAERADFGAVMHSHALYPSMFAVAQKPIPALIDEFAVEIGGEIPVASYAISGTPELAANVLEAFGPYGRAALMANHGLVVGGQDLDHVLALSIAIDRTAHIVFGAEQLGGAMPLDEAAYSLYTALYEYKVREDLGEV